MRNDLTTGDLLRTMVRFSVPYVISCFLQTFYGLADLFITGQFNGAAPVTAVAVGSQVMHMLTVILVGLAMGTTVSISHAIGERRADRAALYIGNSATLFAVLSLAATLGLMTCVDGVLSLLSTPEEAVPQARDYLFICFAGIPFVTAYNVVSGVFRGMGDTRSPMAFVAAAGVVNIALDYLLIGPCGMGAAGAALATVVSQAFSVALAVLCLARQGSGGDSPRVTRRSLVPQGPVMGRLLQVGLPIACQDGLIQVSFLIITAIANSRGVDVAAAVGIVEKVISFLFLVLSAMLSTVSAVAAQNAGAGKHDRGRRALYYGMGICAAFGTAAFVVCQFVAGEIVALFAASEPEVVRLGAQYLRSYSLDCVFAGLHFCFSGYFSAYGKALYSFLHNLISIAAVRIPGTYLAALLFPATLYPMGLAAPLGSLLSVVICTALHRRHFNEFNEHALT